MSVDNNNFKEQRRRRAESFQLNIQDNYDYEGESVYDDSAELNSYSGQDVKEQIARDSKHALKKKKKQQSVLMAEIGKIVEKSLKATVDKALDDIFKDWK